MDYWTAILLGAVQGITEFLPVSSSGHLVVLQQLLGVTLPDETLLTFDVALHFATLIAVAVIFYKDILLLCRGLTRWIVGARDEESRTQARLALWVILGTLPAAFVGILFQDVLEKLFSSVMAVAWMWLVTGTFLWGTKFLCPSAGVIQPSTMTWRHSLLVGLAQAVAITPGISRSGATIVSGLFLKFDREMAARFSFLLAIPAIGGGMLLKYNVLAHFQMDQLKTTVVGMLVAAVVGTLSLRFLVGVVKKGQLHWFAFYCWTVGAITLIASFLS